MRSTEALLTLLIAACSAHAQRQSAQGPPLVTQGNPQQQGGPQNQIDYSQQSSSAGAGQYTGIQLLNDDLRKKTTFLGNPDLKAYLNQQPLNLCRPPQAGMQAIVVDPRQGPCAGQKADETWGWEYVSRPLENPVRIKLIGPPERQGGDNPNLLVPLAQGDAVVYNFPPAIGGGGVQMKNLPMEFNILPPLDPKAPNAPRQPKGYVRDPSQLLAPGDELVYVAPPENNQVKSVRLRGSAKVGMSLIRDDNPKSSNPRMSFRVYQDTIVPPKQTFWQRGKAALGSAADAVGAAASAGWNATKTAGQYAKEGLKSAGRATADYAKQAGGAIAAGAKATGNAIVSSAQSAGRAITSGANTVHQGAVALKDAIAEDLNGVTDAVKDGLSSVAEAVREGIVPIEAAARQYWKSVSDAAEKGWDWAMEGLSNEWEEWKNLPDLWMGNGWKPDSTNWSGENNYLEGAFRR